jgi:MoxR-like ATPase
VIPEDVKEVAVPALSHRITLRPEMWLRRIDPSFVVTEVLGKTPAPASAALPTYGAAGPASSAGPAPSPRAGSRARAVS